MEIKLDINCDRMRALMTETGCRHNRNIASSAFDKVTVGEIYKLTAIEMYRLFHCGDCPQNATPLPMESIATKVEAEIDQFNSLISQYTKEHPAGGGIELPLGLEVGE